MENKRIRFIDDDGLSESSSLTHLLIGDDHEDCGDMEMITHSPYFTESDFHKLHSHKGNLNVMSLNCQSIHAKFDEFRLFISRINKFSPIGAICLQETWTSKEDDISMYHLHNYKLFHQGKICCNHGGLFIYVHDIFEAELSNFVYNHTKWEGFCVKLIQTRPYVKQYYTICNVYRPPYEGADDFELFNKEFTDFLNIISTTGQSFICGDVIINLLKKILTKPNYNTFFESRLC